MSSIPTKRAKREYKTHRKIRTTDYLELRSEKLPDSSWTDQETTALFCCFSTLQKMPIRYCTEHLHTLYSLICESDSAKASNLGLRSKTARSITSKIEYMSQVASRYK
jgi:hypothetical protein